MFKKFLLVLGVFLNAVIIYNADSYYDRYRFAQLCKNEGGTRVYEKVEKNAGWEMEKSRTNDWSHYLDFDNIGFVRFINKEGKAFDATKHPLPKPRLASEYIIRDADESIPVRYTYKIIIENKRRTHKEQIQIIDNFSKNIVVTHTYFSFGWPDLLITPIISGESCFNYSDRLIFHKFIFEEGV